MSTLLDIYNASQPKGTFACRVQGAVIQTCYDVVGEGTGVADHDIRLSLAKKALKDPRLYTEKYYRIFLADPTLQNNLDALDLQTDATILSAVASFWTVVAKLEV